MKNTELQPPVFYHYDEIHSCGNCHLKEANKGKKCRIISFLDDLPERGFMTNVFEIANQPQHRLTVSPTAIDVEDREIWKHNFSCRVYCSIVTSAFVRIEQFLEDFRPEKI